MSISSYRKNVAKGVTGKYSDTCFPAAFEQISPYNRFEPQIYKKYCRFVSWYGRQEGQDKRQRNPVYKDMLAEIAWNLGEVDFDNIEFERAETYRNLSRIVRKLVRHDYRVAIDITTPNCEATECHAIGLVAVGDEYYTARSTWIPRGLYGYFGLRDLFEIIEVPNDPPRLRYPFNDANITALPPAA
jgi:hypothetical protein